MIDWRLYRVAFLAVVPAVVAVLFAVEPVARPLPPGIATTGFDGRAAASVARQIQSLGQPRTAGSQADARAARLLAERFSAIPAGSVTRVPVAVTALSAEPTAETVSVTIPGESPEAILVIAPRAADSEAGQLARATGTGVLTQLAASFGEVRHAHTLVFASVPDAAGATELARRIAQERRVIGSIAIDDARGLRTDDLLLHRAPGDLAASATLAETAREVIGGEGVANPGTEPPLEQLARLALGISFGTQARMLPEGIDTVALSATGELPPRDDDGAPARVLRLPLEVMGQVALRVVQALDAAPELPDEPGSYVRFGENVVPGWAFALLSLTLLLPALLAVIDALARSARRGRAAAAALQSVLARSVPFVAAALLLYVMAATGIVPDPSFPFDPSTLSLGAGEAIALGALALTALALSVPLRVTAVPASYGAATLAAAAGFVACLAVAGVWAANPFAALLLVPLAHVWVLAAGERRPSRALAAIAIAAAIAPVAAASAHVADRLELGSDAPWTLAMLITGGQLRPAQVLIGCVLAGALVAVTAASMRRVND